MRDFKSNVWSAVRHHEEIIARHTEEIIGVVGVIAD